MTIARHLQRASLALIALMLSMGFQTAFAVGTTAGTTISNSATVDYSVSGVSQTQITSNTAQFVVDNRIDLVVEEVSGNPTVTSPGQTNVIASFTVRNDGNFAQGFLLSADNQATATASPFPSGTADNQDVGNVRVFVDDTANGTLNAYDAEDTDTNIVSLAPDASVRVFILADVPVGAANGQFANVELTAVAVAANTLAALTESNGADDPSTVQIVFGDAGRDRTESAVDQYEIQSAALAVVKSSAVIEDDFNGVSPNAKAVPNAVVEYTVTITNNSTTTDATDLQISDAIPPNTTYEPGSLWVDGVNVTDANDGDAGRYEAAPTPRIVGAVPTVAQDGGSVEITFRVRIN